MSYYMIVPDGINQPMLTFEEDSAYREYCAFRAGRLGKENANFARLTGYDWGSTGEFVTSKDGVLKDALFYVSSMLCVSEVGREIMERFTPGTCIFWPIQLFARDGSSYQRPYWIMETDVVVTAEYVAREKDLWWGDKVGRSFTYPYYDARLDMPDLMGPELFDWRPVARHVFDAGFKLTLLEIGQHRFWKSFIWKGDSYFAEEALASALLEASNNIGCIPIKVVKKKWLPEEQLRPLLEWIEAKPERKLEWIRRYPMWVERHRPDWMQLTKEI